jgi:acyl-CoA synthetase (AMP-forming)/AMP-acid ligase II
MKTIPEQLLSACEREPERLAIKVLRSRRDGGFDEAAVTLEALLAGARQRAATLAEAGVKAGDRVLLSLPTSASFATAFFGAQWLGAVPVPLPSMAGMMRARVYLNRLTGVARDAAPRAVISDAETAAIVREPGVLARDVAVLVDGAEDATAADVTTAASTLPRHALDADHPAFIQYTSGSTGRPKGVVITHGNLAANVAAAVHAARFCRDDVFLSWLPVYHDLGLIGGIIVPTSCGAAAHIMPATDFVVDPSSWLRAASTYRATIIMAPNFAYSLVAHRLPEAATTGLDLSSVRLAFNGAEPIDLPTAERFMERFSAHGLSSTSYYPVYGLAETTLSATFPPVERPFRVDHVRRDDVAARRWLAPVDAPGAGVISSLAVGRAFPGHELAIVDPDGDEVLGERRLGEIVLSGPSISPFYFRAGPTQTPRERLRTGDLGYLADGELFVVDRLKDLIIIGGACYVPADIEAVAEGVPGVRVGRSAALCKRPEAEGTESLVVVAEARVGWRDDRRTIERAIRAAIRDEIGLVPSEVVLLRPRTLSLTSSGKLMRGDAKERYARDGFERERAHPPLHPRSVLAGASELVARLGHLRRLVWP